METNDIAYQKYITALMDASNLTLYQAKTIFYYCLLTWAPPDTVQHKPILNIAGESGTGKNSTMEVSYPWCEHDKKDPNKKRPEWITAENMTEAKLRDELADTTTAFIEEGEKANDQQKAESWYKLRYDDTSKEKRYTRYALNDRNKPVYLDEVHNHFGFTVIHSQNPFQTPEFQRRTITVAIQKKSDRQYKKTFIDIDFELTKIVQATIDWVTQLEFGGNGSAWDCWEPLIRVAGALKDKAFVEYALKQVEEKGKEDDTNKLFEPKYMVLSEIIPLYLQRCAGGPPKIALTEIRDELKQRDCSLREMQIAKLARNWGFETYAPGGKTYVKVVSRNQISEIAAKGGIDTNAFIEDEKTIFVQQLLAEE